MKKLLIFAKSYIYALVSCVYLFTFGFLGAGNRSLIRAICKHFGFYHQIIIPEISIEELIKESSGVELLELKANDGNVSFTELNVIANLIKIKNPANLFEIGTFDGRTTLNMAANCSQNAKVYTLDLLKDNVEQTKLPLVPYEKNYINKEVIGGRFKNTKFECKIKQLLRL